MKKSKAQKTPSVTPLRPLKQIADDFAETFLHNHLEYLCNSTSGDGEEEKEADQT